MWYDVHGAAAIGRATLAMAALPIVPLPDAYWRERGPFLARLYAAHGPVVRALLGQTEVVFLLGPAANRCVLQTQRRSFASRRLGLGVRTPLVAAQPVDDG